MGMTGIEIYKLLPQTNCGDCGVPTCLAFAMKLAAGQAELAKCPHVSDASKAKLDSASAPPVLPVSIGAFKTGGETVLFRHEKTFVNPTGIAVLVTDAMSDTDVDRRLKAFAELRYDRVGMLLAADLVAVKSTKGDAAAFGKLVAEGGRRGRRGADPHERERGRARRRPPACRGEKAAPLRGDESERRRGGEARP